MMLYPNDLNGSIKIKRCENSIAVGAKFSFPTALDLFTRRGATSLSRLSELLRRGGYGGAALWPQDECGTPSELRAARLLAAETDERLLPLPAGRHDGVMAEIGLMARGGEKLFCVENACSDLRRLRNLFCYAADFDVRLAVVPSLAELCEKGQINEGEASSRLGMNGLPASAESLAVEICLTLADEFAAPLHLHGLSCRASVEMARAAKARGQDVTCDVQIANLIFDESVYEAENLTGALKLWPALRRADDRAALWSGLADGTIDAITSGYNARSADELALPFEEIPFGSERLETALADLLNAWEAQGQPCPIEKIFAALSDGPQKILSAPDAPQGGYTICTRTAEGWQVARSEAQDEN